jgi:hypothetical protein
VNYAHFDDAHHEYVITDPHTPVKWINYIGTLAFGGFVDHTGGRLSVKATRLLIASPNISSRCPHLIFEVWLGK